MPSPTPLIYNEVYCKGVSAVMVLLFELWEREKNSSYYFLNTCKCLRSFYIYLTFFFWAWRCVLDTTCLILPSAELYLIICEVRFWYFINGTSTFALELLITRNVKMCRHYRWEYVTQKQNFQGCLENEYILRVKCMKSFKPKWIGFIHVSWTGE